MTITVSVVLLLGIAVAVLIRFKAVAVGAAVVVLLFGFYLSDTGAAPTIRELTTSIANAVRDIGN
ncbi:hypothetical protein G5C51_08160 [Streptomyces sp. A7024]|uniref:Uncharacterized protein n=1 Tax=Streptomyces coryli TaxID=1128680 RepID=A0A6G4TWI4_9ACTN|nr:hypothetical protein [Streptomyces coryli]NGN63880.1 hypothetical protein [Streptomyces coryli]